MHLLYGFTKSPETHIQHQDDVITLLAQDVTTQHALEQSLHEAKTLAEKTLLDHKHFLSMVSHEFRTPLESILQSFQLMQLHHNTNTAIPSQLIERVGRAAIRMIEFMDNLYVMDRFDTTCWKINPTSFALDGFIQSIIDEHKMLFPNRCIVNHSLPILTVNWDIDLMRVVMNNLLSNALKYSPIDTHVSITITQVQHFILINVQDQGPGIDHDILPNIFNRYVRSSQVGNIPSTGMGLHIIHRIVSLHHGTITLNNIANSGLLVTIHIPA